MRNRSLISISISMKRREATYSTSISDPFVNKDLWEQVEVFMRKSLEDEEMGWWSPDGAWPGAS
jgi:hypothetical protein